MMLPSSAWPSEGLAGLLRGRGPLCGSVTRGGWRHAAPVGFSSHQHACERKPRFTLGNWFLVWPL